MSRNDTYPQHVVTAVIVAHDGAPWLPHVVDALLGQTRPVQRVVAVDTGSRDRSGGLLASKLGQGVVFGMDRSTGYGAAVARALQHKAANVAVPGQSGQSRGDRVEWIWLLHDDCEPAADALEQLLRGAAETPKAAVLGPKVMDFADRDVILEAGVTIDTVGRRITGIEPREVDQGQHDGDRDTLAVGSAGMLVRRDVWEQVRGFDTSMGLFREDVDLCWRVHAAGYRVRVITDAVVFHAQAMTKRRRAVSAGRRPQLLDRRNAMLTLAGNLPLRPMFRALIGNIGVSVLRALFFLVAKRVTAALDETAAVASVICHPLRLLRARRLRSRGRASAYGRLRGELPPGRSFRRIAEFAAAMSSSAQQDTTGSHHATDDPEADDSLLTDSGLVQRVLTSPSVLLFIGLLVITIVAERSVLGAGALSGGTLLPAPDGASGLWHEYLQGFHAVGIGSPSIAPPYLAILAVLSTVLLGKAWLAVDVVLLGSVPIAGLTAYLAVRRVTRSVPVRVWAAASYALLPVATGAIAAGRLGTAAAFALIPVVGLQAGRMFTEPPRMARRAAWATALSLAAAAAFVPLTWLIGLVGAGLAALFLWLAGRRTAARRARPEGPGARPDGRGGRGGRQGAGMRAAAMDAMRQARRGGQAGPAGAAGLGVVLSNLGIAVLAPLLLLIPWIFQLAGNPSALLLEAGAQQPGLASPDLPARSLLLLSPGGPGLPPTVVTGGLLLAALAALLASRGRRLIMAGWAVAVLGLLVAALTSHLTVHPATGGPAVTAWPGAALAVTAAGLLLAASACGDSLGGLLAAGRTGLRRLASPRGALVAVLAIAACSAPAAAAASWVLSGVSGPIGPAPPQEVPSLVAASSGRGTQIRTLVLDSSGPSLSYQLLRGTSPELGDADLIPVPAAERALRDAVAALVAPAGGQAVDQGKALARFDIGFVIMRAPVNQALARTLDGVPGLRPVSMTQAFGLWRLANLPARVSVVEPDGAVVPVPSGQVDVSGAPAPSAGGTLMVAEPAGGWNASLNGQSLTPVTSPAGSWAQAFRLPPGGGTLNVSRGQLGHDIAIAFELLAALVVAALGLPGVRASAEAQALAALGASVPEPDEDEPVRQPAAGSRGMPGRDDDGDESGRRAGGGELTGRGQRERRDDGQPAPGRRAGEPMPPDRVGASRSAAGLGGAALGEAALGGAALGGTAVGGAALGGAALGGAAAGGAALPGAGAERDALDQDTQDRDGGSSRRGLGGRGLARRGAGRGSSGRGAGGESGAGAATGSGHGGKSGGKSDGNAGKGKGRGLGRRGRKAQEPEPGLLEAGAEYADGGQDAGWPEGAPGNRARGRGGAEQAGPGGRGRPGYGDPDTGPGASPRGPRPDPGYRSPTGAWPPDDTGDIYGESPAARDSTGRDSTGRDGGGHGGPPPARGYDSYDQPPGRYDDPRRPYAGQDPAPLRGEGRPARGQPEPSYGGYSASGHRAPDYSASNHGASDYSASDHGASGYGAPDYGDPGYGGRGYSAPGRAGGGRGAGPDYGTPGYGSPDYGTPGYGAAAGWQEPGQDPYQQHSRDQGPRGGQPGDQGRYGQGRYEHESYDQRPHDQGYRQDSYPGGRPPAGPDRGWEGSRQYPPPSAAGGWPEHGDPGRDRAGTPPSWSGGQQSAWPEQPSSSWSEQDQSGSWPEPGQQSRPGPGQAPDWRGGQQGGDPYYGQQDWQDDGYQQGWGGSGDSQQGWGGSGDSLEPLPSAELHHGGPSRRDDHGRQRWPAPGDDDHEARDRW